MNEGFDAAEKADKPAEPETEKPQAPAADAQPEPGWTAEDRAVLDKMTPEAREWAATKTAAMHQTYGGVDALAAKHGAYLSSLGATTPEAQVGALDRLLSTERTLRTGSPQQKAAIFADLARQYGVGAQAPAPAPPAGPAAHPLQAAALAPPQAAPVQAPPADPNDLRARLESDWQQQRAAATASATAEAQQAARQQEHRQIVGQIQEFAGQKDEHGHPRHALLGAVVPEMIEAANMLRQAGHTPDLPTIYKAAVRYAKQTRPEVAQAVLTDSRRKVRAFQHGNPVAFDPQLQRRMTSVAEADRRITGEIDLKTVLARALKLEPEIAARQESHAAAEKEMGFKSPRPSLRQELEAAWSAQTAA